MPEGDTVAGHARRLRPILVGKVIDQLDGTAASVRVNSQRILGATVIDLRTFGKNLVVDLATGYSIRVHLGMPGRWRVGEGALPPNRSARLSLGTESGWAVCHSAPTVHVDRTPAIDAALARLGPDLLGGFDEEEFVGRARALPSRSVAEMLLDQRVLAGIGNVYKSELLFIEGIHPATPVGQLDDEQLRDLASCARSLLAVNVGPEPRTTTGRRGQGAETWVYGRDGLPCRRCGELIRRESRRQRVTFWCPQCQRDGSSSASSPALGPEGPRSG